MTEKTGPPWTVLKILNWTTDFFEKRAIESARMDAEYLLADVLDLSRVMLYANFDRPLTDDELARFKALIKRRGTHEPIAYILGVRSFWDFEFEVNSDVLIPRADTERLIEVVLERASLEMTKNILDIGTGSGAIAITLKSEFKNAVVFATDISESALQIARTNAENLELECQFLKSDLFENVEGRFDIIVSNPPYIDAKERDLMDESVLKFEPELALFPPGGKGLLIYETLIPEAVHYLKGGGLLALEIGFQQGSAVKHLFEEAGFHDVRITKDYNQRDRVVSGLIR